MGAGDKVELVISRWAGPHADDQAAILKQFENETGIRVRMDAIDYFQLRQEQMLNLSGKTGAYDLVWVQEVWLPEYVSSGYLLPLNDLVKDESLSGKDFDLQDFNPNLIKINTIDGKLGINVSLCYWTVARYETPDTARRGHLLDNAVQGDVPA